MWVVSVVRRRAQRRWALVGASVAAICLLPVAVALWPGPGVRAEPERLRELILASASQPYQGYVDVRGQVNLPKLPAIGQWAAPLGRTTRMRTWYAGPHAWRVAELTPTGETDTYRTGDGRFVWDFERNLLTQMIGEPPARLPRTADLLPPDLARRMLGSRGGSFSAIGSQRVAGVAAVGLRMTPTDPDTTVGRVDVWADPDSGLPVRVEVAGRTGRAVVTSRFLELDQRTPQAQVLVPAHPDTAGNAVTTGTELAEALNGVAPVPLPATLDGWARLAGPAGASEVIGLGAYGTGLTVFAVVALPGRVGLQSLQAIRDAGGAPVPVVGGEAYEIGTALVNALVVRTSGDRGRRRTYLLVGSVSPPLLRRAGAELIAPRPDRP